MYQDAKERYSRYGIDTEAVIAKIKTIPISMNCWQGDDVIGFEKGARALSGGIQTTGNYPGRARNAEELMRDFEFASSFIPGAKRLNLHASYLVSSKEKDRNEIEPEDYKAWVDFARKNNLGLDFNPTCFSHPMVVNNLTLSSPHKEVRDFWIEHCRRSRLVAKYFADELGTYSLCNLWIPDGFKDTPADRITPRLRLKEALDEIYAEKLDGVIDSVESKVFGIGVESFTVGSSEFYLAYAATHGIYQLLDSGHYHPTEVISEKLSALLCYFDRIPLHVTRAVRWDSDHVVILNDSVQMLAQEIVWADALSRVNIGLDYFDASINRIGAYVIGIRATQKAFLQALLSPIGQLREYEASGRNFERLALLEEAKGLPWNDVFNYFCLTENVPIAEDYIADIEQYEKDITSKR